MYLAIIFFHYKTINMLQPIGRNVLIKPTEKTTQTKGGIYIPDPSQHNDNTGTIIAIGNEVEEVDVNDFVTYEAKGLIHDEDYFTTCVDRIMYVHKKPS